jgi:hypothetical protein
MARSGVFAKSGRTDSMACNVDRRYPASKLHGWRRRRLGRSVWGCDSNWTKNNVSASKTEMVVLDFPSHGV